MKNEGCHRIWKFLWSDLIIYCDSIGFNSLIQYNAISLILKKISKEKEINILKIYKWNILYCNFKPMKFIKSKILSNLMNFNTRSFEKYTKYTHNKKMSNKHLHLDEKWGNSRHRFYEFGNIVGSGAYGEVLLCRMLKFWVVW